MEMFERVGCRNTLAVTATTGCAAKFIRGSTIDSVCGLGRSNKWRREVGGDEGANYNKLQVPTDSMWTACSFLIIDEVSMAGCIKLTKISAARQKSKEKHRYLAVFMSFLVVTFGNPPCCRYSFSHRDNAERYSNRNNVECEAPFAIPSSAATFAVTIAGPSIHRTFHVTISEGTLFLSQASTPSAVDHTLYRYQEKER